MPNLDSDTPPVSLAQVLEDEYVKLHNAPPPTYPADATEDQRLGLIIKNIHALGRKRSALCLSGGGIRSATFALGIIQGLARCGVLDKFDYLSTVSGGGYVGSWLTAWAHRYGLESVIRKLTAAPPSLVAPEPGPVSRLRDYSSYLNPNLGLLSTETWTLGTTVLRDLLLNWLVLIPLLAAVLIIPRVVIPVMQLQVTHATARACLIVGCIQLVFAIGYMGFFRPSSRVLRGDQRGYVTWCLLPLILGSILIVTYWAWAGHRIQWNSVSLSLGGDTISVREDLLVFLALGIAINFIALLGGAVLRARKVDSSRLFDVISVIFTGALTGALIWCAATILFPNPLKSPTNLLLYVCFASPAFLMAFVLSKMVYAGLSSYSTSDHDREWWARSDAWVLIYIVVWSAASTLLIFGPMAVLGFQAEVPTVAASVASGLITIMIGGSSNVSSKSRSEKKEDKKKDKKEEGSWQPLLVKYSLALSASTFAISLFVLIALGAEILFHRSIPYTWEDYRLAILVTTFRNLSIFICGLTAFGLVMGLFININKFSLHNVYRNRLIRAYLGASREHRVPNLFTGMDDSDNIQMHALWPGNDPPHSGSPRQPLHVINMALNVVVDNKLAWQQRKTESFTVSPLHAGNYRVGYRRIAYEVNGEKIYYGARDGISLGTAIAISGVGPLTRKPSYQSSPVIAFLITLSRRTIFRALNARVGWWLGNPGPGGQRTFRFSSPMLAVRPMINEVLGLDDNRYVYLSDGGHFENLGLYEMVLRRCHTIVVSDAGQDGDFRFDDLGGAVRKIRLDLGIPITFENGIQIYSRAQQKQGYYCALGRIGYPSVDGADALDGILIYIKPTVYGSEPVDVYQYAQTNRAFPHDATTEPFDESQFESYRMLGSYIISLIFGDAWVGPSDEGDSGEDGSLAEFVNKIRNYVDRP